MPGLFYGLNDPLSGIACHQSVIGARPNVAIGALAKGIYLQPAVFHGGYRFQGFPFDKTQARMGAYPYPLLRVFKNGVHIIGGQALLGGINLKIVSVKPAESTALCAQPHVPATVLQGSKNLRLWQSLARE